MKVSILWNIGFYFFFLYLEYAAESWKRPELQQENVKQITEKCLPEKYCKILQRRKFKKITSFLSGGLHQTLKKSTSMRRLCSVCSHNYTHIHIKPEMGQTKELSLRPS